MSHVASRPSRGDEMKVYDTKVDGANVSADYHRLAFWYASLNYKTAFCGGYLRWCGEAPYVGLQKKNRTTRESEAKNIKYVFR